jgi:dipeptidyl aminopeptidase/acylaminoacyl peptidase
VVATLPHGSWPSPISASLVAAGGIGVGGPAAHGPDVVWSELRPAEGGRVVLVRRRGSGRAADVLPAPWSARTRVHEYGGGAWWLGGTAIWFANWDDQRLYRLDDGRTQPVAVTPEPPDRHAWRYADGAVSPDGRWVACVREDHTGPDECRNEVVLVPADGSVDPVVVVSGPDFVAAPRWSPDGSHLSWIEWDHPNMPWDGTELRVATVTGSEEPAAAPVVGLALTVAGGPAESVVGAEWTTDGRLVFATDRSGWWNLASWRPGAERTDALTDLDAEIGGPQWVFGLCPWAELPDGRLAVVVTESATDHLAVLEVDGSVRRLATPFTAVDGVAVTERGGILVVAAGPTALPAVAEVDPATGAVTEHRPPDDLGIDPAWFSVAEPVEFASEGGRRAHAFLYRPTGADVAGPPDERPPLLVISHGGPTSHTRPALSLKVQYWTSRGFAVVDVNYGGSTGYGRPYRRLLDDAWGIVDVQDCTAAARHLADIGVVDPARLAIRGGSAGGFTTLAALTSSDVFAAGCSLYGVADLEALARDTHKFESRYLDGLVGPYPEARQTYVERSPITHTDRLSCPLLVLQGLEDEIVPPNQAEAIVAALAAKGIPHAYIAFEGEQHGFRQAASIVRSLEAELWFYGKVFGFAPADRIEPVAGAVGLG